MSRALNKLSPWTRYITFQNTKATFLCDPVNKVGRGHSQAQFLEKIEIELTSLKKGKILIEGKAFKIENQNGHTELGTYVLDNYKGQRDSVGPPNWKGLD